MQLTDWRGNAYGPGSRVIYAAMSGRSVELQEATVLEINTVYRDSDSYKWKPLKEGDPVPKKQVWDAESREYIDSDEDVATELRVKLQPEGKGSRNFSMRNDTEHWYVDPDGNEHTRYEMKAILERVHGPEWSCDVTTGYHFIRHWDCEDFGWALKTQAVKPRPVTLTVISNITVI